MKRLQDALHPYLATIASAAILLTWLACSKPKDAQPKPQIDQKTQVAETAPLAGRETIKNFLASQGFGEVIAGDKDYFLPDEAWLKEFTRALADEQNSKGLTYLEYENPEWNCNKFARFAHVVADERWLKDPARIPGRALAFAEVWYRPSKDPEADAHAIDFIVSRNRTSGELEIHFFEPQAATGHGEAFPKLTPEQISGALGMF